MVFNKRVFQRYLKKTLTVFLVYKGGKVCQFLFTLVFYTKLHDEKYTHSFYSFFVRMWNI
jgi:hypothetical protein